MYNNGKNKNKRMKSIKEKSKEHAPYTREDSWSRTQRSIIAQTSFEAGANYVIGAIEWLLNSQKFVDNPLQGLFELIEQLKK